jgi:hypothetical protein
MTIPAILFGLLVALLIGALFHLWRGGNLVRLLAYLGLSVGGFAAGQWTGSSRGWGLFSVGPLDLGMGIAGCLVFLGIGYWLGLVRIGRKTEGAEDAV